MQVVQLQELFAKITTLSECYFRFRKFAVLVEMKKLRYGPSKGKLVEMSET